MRALLIGAVEGTRVALEALAAARDWDIAAVATLPGRLAARHSDHVDLAPTARAAGTRLIEVANTNDPGFIVEMTTLAPDMVFVIGWSQIVGDAFRDAVGGRVIGYHPAPLPRLRGRAVIPWTILLDEKITASTLFRIDAGVDSGEILAQRFFHVAPDETAATLYEKHMWALAAMLAELLPRLARGEPVGEAQDERYATWATRRRPEDGLIDWQRPAVEIDRLIRAAGRPYPGAFTMLDGAPLTIWRGGPVDASRHHALPGQVVATDAHGFTVRCGCGGAIRVDSFDSGSGKRPALHVRLGAG